MSNIRFLKKWNYERHDYEDYLIPGDWKVSMYEEDMNTPVNCAHCGKLLPFGDCYTSQEIHNAMGMGYAVCENCYDEEVKRRNKTRAVE